jgi:hypothetical protein
MRTAADAMQCGVFFAGLCGTYFLWTYTRRAHWWRYRVGRAMASLGIAVLMLLLPLALHYVFGLSTANLFFTWYYAVNLWAVGFIELYRGMVVRHPDDE